MDTGHVRLSGKAGAVAYDAQGRAERGGQWFKAAQEIDGSKIGEEEREEKVSETNSS